MDRYPVLVPHNSGCWGTVRYPVLYRYSNPAVFNDAINPIPVPVVRPTTRED